VEDKQCIISIVMPVYNVEKYLPQCLDSIFSQTMEEFEIIAVNDGSTDNSLSILESYRDKAPEKLRIYTIENSGVSHARNYGMQQARGEFVLFVDSDDFIEPDMCEKLYNKAVKDNNDIVVCGRYSVYEKERIKQYKKKIVRTQLLNENFKLAEHKYELAHLSPFPWDKLFRRSLLSGMNFPEGIRFEDLVLIYELACKAGSIGVVEEPLYNYRRTRQGGFLNTFSERTLDIIKAFRLLTDFMKDNGYFEQYYEELEYICARHFLFRYGHLYKKENKGTGQLNIKLRIINETQSFLDREYPTWRNNHYLKYSSSKELKAKLKLYSNRRKMVLMTTIREYTPFIIIRILRKLRNTAAVWKSRLKKFLKSDSKKKLIARKIPFITMLKRSSPACYISMLKKLPVDPKVILLESKHGEDVAGNIFALLRELTNGEYEGYQILLALLPELMESCSRLLEAYDITGVSLIDINSRKYLMALATAGYLITDTSFPPYFIKRSGQKYLNTWHGTPLKAMGRIVPEREYALGNVQRNFLIADYLLYQNDFAREIFLRDYMLDKLYPGTVLTCGYPRNSAFFSKERYAQIRKEAQLSDKRVVAYMPTWRGLLHQKENDKQIADLKEYFNIIDRKLGSDTVFYVKLHPYVKEELGFDGFTHIREFPREYETYDFLNACDVLVTDYSSIMFDFGVTKRKIVLFVYDRKEYLKDRGIYVGLEELDLPKVETPQELADELMKDAKPYPKFFDRFCSYDNADVPKQVASQLLYGKTTGSGQMKAEAIKPVNKKKVLILINGMKKNDNAARLIRNINSIDTSKYDVYVCMNSNKVKKATSMLSKLKKETGYFPLSYNTDYSRKEYLAAKFLQKTGLLMGFKGKLLEAIAEREVNKYFGSLRFDIAVHHSEEDLMALLLCRKLADKVIFNFKYYDHEKYRLSQKYYKRTRLCLKLLPSYDLVVATNEIKRLKKGLENINIMMDESPEFPFERAFEEVGS
jgi:CDP-glycerol glycerophosphotransferase